MSASPPAWPALCRVRPVPALTRGSGRGGTRVIGQTSGSTTWRRPSCCRSIWIGGGPLRRRDRAGRRRERREIEERFPAVRPSDSSSQGQRRSRPKKPRCGRNPPAGFPLLIVALLLVGVALGAYLVLGAGLRGEDEPVTIAVEQGDTLSSVADKLEEAGVVRSSLLFELKARYDGWDK